MSVQRQLILKSLDKTGCKILIFFVDYTEIVPYVPLVWVLQPVSETKYGIFRGSIFMN